MKVTAASTIDNNAEYKRSLIIVFYIHVVMFFVVFVAGYIAKSTAVLADSLDFIGDAANYALSMYVLNKSLRLRSYAAILKAMTMLCGGIPIFIYALIRYQTGTLPNHEIMSLSGLLGIIAHAVCIYYLYQFRSGDSNLLSVWICTINDLISNVLIIIASILVLLSGSIVPDIFAAVIIVSLAFFGACAILKRAIDEIKK
jgi:Co/Zn/Cd efflux system component